MRNQNSIVIVVALAVCAVAWSVPWTAQGGQCLSSSAGSQPVSWYAVGQNVEELILVPNVGGPTGVVITHTLHTGSELDNA